MRAEWESKDRQIERSCGGRKNSYRQRDTEKGMERRKRRGKREREIKLMRETKRGRKKEIETKREER